MGMEMVGDLKIKKLKGWCIIAPEFYINNLFLIFIFVKIWLSRKLSLKLILNLS